MIKRKQYPNHHVYEMEIGGREFTVETGKVAELRQHFQLLRGSRRMNGFVWEKRAMDFPSPFRISYLRIPSLAIRAR